MRDSPRSPRSEHSYLTLLAFLALAITLGLFACRGGDPLHLQTQVRDSAGVLIVESRSLPETEAGGWSLEQRPSLSIGTFEGDTIYQFYQVSGGLRLPDGRIAISDNGNLQLRLFGPDGTFLRAFGREGEGPGEFRSMEILGILGPDTLEVVDPRLRRISLYHPEGGLLEQVTIEAAAGPTLVTNGMLDDGAILLGGELSFGPGGDTPRNGLNRSEARYRLLNRRGLLEVGFGSIPGAELYMQTRGSGGELYISAVPVPFGKRPAAHARGSRVFMGSADTYEILGFDRRGRMDKIIRVLEASAPVTSRAVDRLIEERVADLPDPAGAPAMRSLLREIPTPETVPAYQNLTLDSEGFLWVEDFRPPGVGLRTWAVFDGEGVPRARLSLPATNRVLEIGEDYLLTVFSDARGIEYVRLYSLERRE
jgi:hypothetical protein